MKQQLEQLLLTAVSGLVGGILPETHEALQVVRPAAVAVERTRDPKHGDFATNIALRLAKPARRSPRELAQAIIDALPPNSLIARTEVAGAGFINFFLTTEAYGRELTKILEMGDRYGRSSIGNGEKVMLEFVSANPTGPLHVGHGRQAAYGATLANLLNAVGYNVSREYYINDAGRQVDILTASVWLRYLEQGGEQIPFPSNGYRGDYVKPIGELLRSKVGGDFHRSAALVLADLPQDTPENKDVYIDAVIERCRELIGVDGFYKVLELALERMLADIRDDLEQFGVAFDRWYSERALGESGAIDRALERLKTQGRLYEKDGATWFRATEFGDEKDRVVVRDNGVKTYFASDIAYHLEKRERGFERLIDVLGADHHGYVARVRAGLEAMGEPGNCLEVNLIQFVSLFRGGEKIPMGKREAQFVTLRELRSEVGNDACRFFYLISSHDQPLDFDLELAKSRTRDNPVYYIQYAHARVSSVMKEADARGYAYNREEGLENISFLVGDNEQAVLKSVTRYPEALELAATNRSPHILAHYLRDLANSFHTYYNAEKFIVPDAKMRDARLALIEATQQVIRNGLTLLGVSSPETM